MIWPRLLGTHDRMIRLFALLLALSVAAPVLAQGLSAEAIAKQNQAIAIRVQQQLMSCWIVPPGEEDQRLALDIAFFGDGRLDGEAMLAPESAKAASKRGVLTDSILAAVDRCVPFEGLEALGADAEERFSVTIYFQS
ncbi:hypothetical protein JP75_05260 [Devosia riboflavina]|uniref:TonB C-terminal domain-containing protein n=1 Tax=Devosia riboflavina TaxID=46914 RepID=A0A087M650_9HYPH|nr:hypothetical protein [Devosia riboflavina]KFL32353.1 hypothetical protein JP75_05260 [Devosia riboflavina]